MSATDATVSPGEGTSLAASPAADTDTLARTSIWQRVRRDVAVLGAGNLGIIVAQLGFRGILIAALVPAAYGRLSLILAVYNTIAIMGASGLPNSASRYIALRRPADDSAIVRSTVRAAFWPTVVTAVVLGVVASILLKSPVAFLFAAVGLTSLVYSALATGILRGRGRLAPAASIMPIAAFSEVGLLAAVWFSGAGLTMMSAFELFCLGNVCGLAAGVLFTLRTSPPREAIDGSSAYAAPTTRTLLGFSMWLGIATMAVTVLPLIMRLAATIDSYTAVAIIDVTLLLLTVPQRVGTVIVSAVVPHATRALEDHRISLRVSRRDHLFIVVPFLVAAVVVAATPIVGWLFDALGRPQYATSADYLALALLAGPARILYGVVEGVLVAHGDGRFLAFNALLTMVVASGVIFAAIALGSTRGAFAVFVLAWWVVYLSGHARIGRLTKSRSLALSASVP